MVGGVGSNCVFPAMSIAIAKFVIAATCAGWSNYETKALFGILGASEVQSQLDGVVRNCTVYEKVSAQLHEAR